MISKVTIVNMALMRCGNYTQIEKLDLGNPSTPEELLAARFYDDTRRECLTMGPWNFAEGEVELTRIAGWPDESRWPFAFAYPTDCVMAREIVPAEQLRAAGYEVSRSDYRAGYLNYVDELKKFVIGSYSQSPGQHTKIIKARVEQPTLIYTVDLDLPTQYSPAFVSMFAWKLAMSMGGALGLDQKQLRTILDGFSIDQSAALAQNANEGDNDEPERTDWLEGRA